MKCQHVGCVAEARCQPTVLIYAYVDTPPAEAVLPVSLCQAHGLILQDEGGDIFNEAAWAPNLDGRPLTRT
jgi:hypothetical protein